MDGERTERPGPSGPERAGPEPQGPIKPEVNRPEGGNELLKRLKKVDPDQAKKYRQRSGQ